MGDFTSGPPMQRQPGQGFGSQPGANGPAGWMQPQTSSWSSQGPQVRGADTMRLGPNLMNGMQGGGYAGGNPANFDAYRQGTFSPNANPYGPLIGQFQQQMQPQMNPNQQMAAQVGGRMGLGNPFNSPYSGMRQPGPNYGMGQNYYQPMMPQQYGQPMGGGIPK